MAINKKLIHFKTKAAFDREYNDGGKTGTNNILDTSIVFIKDSQQIYTHGQFYDCNGLSEDKINDLIDLNVLELESKIKELKDSTDRSVEQLLNDLELANLGIQNSVAMISSVNNLLEDFTQEVQDTYVPKTSLGNTISNTTAPINVSTPTSGRKYAVQTDGNNKLFVNVPWTNPAASKTYEQSWKYDEDWKFGTVTPEIDTCVLTNNDRYKEITLKNSVKTLNVNDVYRFDRNLYYTDYITCEKESLVQLEVLDLAKATPDYGKEWSLVLVPGEMFCIIKNAYEEFINIVEYLGDDKYIVNSPGLYFRHISGTYYRFTDNPMLVDLGYYNIDEFDSVLKYLGNKDSRLRDVVLPSQTCFWQSEYDGSLFYQYGQNIVEIGTNKSNNTLEVTTFSEFLDEFEHVGLLNSSGSVPILIGDAENKIAILHNFGYDWCGSIEAFENWQGIPFKEFLMRNTHVDRVDDYEISKIKYLYFFEGSGGTSGGGGGSTQCETASTTTVGGIKVQSTNIDVNLANAATSGTACPVRLSKNNVGFVFVPSTSVTLANPNSGDYYTIVGTDQTNSTTSLVKLPVLIKGNDLMVDGKSVVTGKLSGKMIHPNYPLNVDSSNNLYVTIPWENTTTATNLTLGDSMSASKGSFTDGEWDSDLKIFTAIEYLKNGVGSSLSAISDMSSGLKYVTIDVNNLKNAGYIASSDISVPSTYTLSVGGTTTLATIGGTSIKATLPAKSSFVPTLSTSSSSVTKYKLFGYNNSTTTTYYMSSYGTDDRAPYITGAGELGAYDIYAKHNMSCNTIVANYLQGGFPILNLTRNYYTYLTFASGNAQINMPESFTGFISIRCGSYLAILSLSYQFSHDNTAVDQTIVDKNVSARWLNNTLNTKFYVKKLVNSDNPDDKRYFLVFSGVGTSATNIAVTPLIPFNPINELPEFDNVAGNITTLLYAQVNVDN